MSSLFEYCIEKIADNFDTYISKHPLILIQLPEHIVFGIMLRLVEKSELNIRRATFFYNSGHEAIINWLNDHIDRSALHRYMYTI